jgi:hypothetical protein
MGNVPELIKRIFNLKLQKADGRKRNPSFSTLQEGKMHF